MWQESGFFDDHRSDLIIPKANVPENTLMYVNQGSVSLVKGGGQAIYLEFMVIGQSMPVANPDPSINLETHVFKIIRFFCMCLFITKQQDCMVALQKN